MTAEYNMKNLLAFIDKNAMPKVMFFNEKAAEKIFTTYIPTMFLIFNQNDEAATTSAKKNFEQFAKSKDFDHFQFCTAQHDDMMGERLVEFFGITEKQLPIFVIIEFTETNLLKFFQDARIGVDGIQQFVQNYFDKKLQPYFKSEEVPEKNDDPVYVSRVISQPPPFRPFSLTFSFGSAEKILIAGAVTLQCHRSQNLSASILPSAED